MAQDKERLGQDPQEQTPTEPPLTINPIEKIDRVIGDYTNSIQAKEAEIKAAEAALVVLTRRNRASIRQSEANIGQLNIIRGSLATFRKKLGDLLSSIKTQEWQKKFPNLTPEMIMDGLFGKAEHLVPLGFSLEEDSQPGMSEKDKWAIIENALAELDLNRDRLQSALFGSNETQGRQNAIQGEIKDEKEEEEKEE